MCTLWLMQHSLAAIKVFWVAQLAADVGLSEPG